MSNSNFIANKFCKVCQCETKRMPSGGCLPCNARRAAKYRTANPEKVKAVVDAWRLENKSKANELSTSWYLSNREKAISNSARWKKENTSSVLGHNHNRRARVKNAFGKLSVGLSAKLFALQRGKCACCGLPLGKDYHLDHIMPLALGGHNTDDNVQLLRKRCNLQKNKKHPVDFMQSRGFLL